MGNQLNMGSPLGPIVCVGGYMLQCTSPAGPEYSFASKYPAKPCMVAA